MDRKVDLSDKIESLYIISKSYALFLIASN